MEIWRDYTEGWVLCNISYLPLLFLFPSPMQLLQAAGFLFVLGSGAGVGSTWVELEDQMHPDHLKSLM